MLKRSILALCVGLSSLALPAQTFDRCDDLVLIPIGSPHRPKWDKELLTPYVVHEFADGRRSWLFDGFMMIDGVYFSPDGMNYTFGESDFPQAPKSMWEILPDIQLGTESGLGCRALDELIGELKPQLGAPGYRHQVVMTLPGATGASQVWGAIDGEDMDFGKMEHRVKAMTWYVDLVIEKWNAAGFKNIELAGFFYVPEHAEDRDIATVKLVTDYIREKGYSSYWIPYYWAWNYQNWEKMGFDQVYYQPNYFFKSDVPLSRLDDAINEAYELNDNAGGEDMRFGMEMEFEGFNYDRNGNVYSPNNNGLYDYSTNHVFYDRFVDYVNKFEEYDVFTFMPLAYYTGYRAV